jgi:hypothetical protein
MMPKPGYLDLSDTNIDRDCGRRFQAEAGAGKPGQNHCKPIASVRPLLRMSLSFSPPALGFLASFFQVLIPKSLHGRIEDQMLEASWKLDYLS